MSHRASYADQPLHVSASIDHSLDPGSESIIDQLAGLSGGAKDRLSPMLEIKGTLHGIPSSSCLIAFLRSASPHRCVAGRHFSRQKRYAFGVAKVRI